MIDRRTFLTAGVAVVSGLSRTVDAAAQRNGLRITTTDLGGATLFQGAGCNVLVVAGAREERRQGLSVDQGALMIDGGLAANAEALVAAVKRATGAGRIDTLINTHWHPEQTGANELVGRGGGAIFAHEKTAFCESHTVYSSVMFKGRLAPLPEKARPTRTTRGDGSMEYAGETLDYGYMPQAHTDGDLYVHIPTLNLLAAGGVVSAQSWPLLDWRNGAWLGGRVRALERLAAIVTPQTRVVPSDGRVMTGAEIVRHRDMYQQLFETMIGYLNMGLGPEDAVQRKPLQAYEREFGDASAFTYGALKSMMIAYVPD
jgi:glyoxylase-like metal-dependent hydrolase (beta-lactamase superfamily II)